MLAIENSCAWSGRALALCLLLSVVPGAPSAQPTLRDLWDFNREQERQRQKNEQDERDSREAAREAAERAADKARLEEALRKCQTCPERPQLIARLKAHEDRERTSRAMFCSTWQAAQLGNPQLLGPVGRWLGVGRACEPQIDLAQARLLAEINFNRALSSTDPAEVDDVASALAGGRYGVREPEKSALLVLRLGGLRGGQDGFELAYARGMYTGTVYAQKDQERALRLIAELATRYPPAMVTLVGYYCRGPFPPAGRNAGEASAWIERYLASAGADAATLYELAQLYRGNDCFDRDATKMRSLLQSAATKGHVLAQRELAGLAGGGQPTATSPAPATVEGPATKPQTSTPGAGFELARTRNCGLCHAMDKQLLGPSYLAIAKRYAGRNDAAALLARHIQRGGRGNWGAMSAPAHPKINDAEALTLAQWVLDAR